MSNAIDTITQKKEDILLAEIAALVHDLGKLSKEFVTEQAERSTQLSFAHHLVLRRTSTGISRPPTVSPQDITDFQKVVQQDVTAWQRDLPQSGLNAHDRNQTKRRLIDANRQKVHNVSNKLAPLLFEESLIPENFLPTHLANALNTIRVSLDSRLGDLTLGDLLEQHHTPYYDQPTNRYNCDASPAVEVLKSCDRADSGVDKAIPQAKQSWDQTYIATVFGYEPTAHPIDLEALTGIRDTVCRSLVRKLQSFPYGQENEIWKWREELLDTLLPSDGQKGFHATLGDTRRTANDVTLADHSYSVSSIFKAALAEALIKKTPEDQLLRSPIHWKLLGVKWDGLEIISKAFRVNDVLGRREMITQVKVALRRFIELEFPIGNKVYDDEDGIYFTVPNLDYEGDHADVKDYLRDKIVEKVNEKSNGEINPSISMLKQKTRSLVQLTWLIKGDGSDHVINLLKDQSFNPRWVSHWDSANKGQSQVDACPICGQQHHDVRGKEHRPFDICPVCQLRPKRESLETCSFCQHWREKGSEVREIVGTHWLDLIADDNNQAALITGRFWLESWLHGEQTDTLFSQSLADWEKDWGQGNYQDLIKRLEQAFRGTDLSVLKEVGGDAWKNRQYQDQINLDVVNNAKVVGDFYKAAVNERDVRELSAKVQTPNERAKWLAHFLFRKHPSPARLRRVWRTTQKFSQQIQENLEEEFESRTTWSFKLDSKHDGDFENGKIYEKATIDKKPVELFYNGRFFYIIDRLKETPREGSEVCIDERAYYITEPPEERTYKPYSSILVSPITFQFLVPADKALDIVNKIWDRYLNEMGKVRNRLPLDIGIVYFKRKTPLYVAVDTARRMLKMRQRRLEAKEHEAEVVEDRPRAEMWKVKNVHTENHKANLLLQTGQGQQIEWAISYELGDATKEDFYHPYFVVTETGPTNPVNQRSGYFYVPALGEQGNLLHVTELCQGDSIEVIPNYFDFEFLDSSTRRYDVQYERNTHDKLSTKEEDNRTNSLCVFGPKKRQHVSLGENGPRPYYLDELDIFDRLWWMLSGQGDYKFNDESLWKGLTITQIKGLEAVLSERLAQWKPEKLTQEFVEAALANVFGQIWKKFCEQDQEAMKKACISGQFFDVIELYIRLSGKKPFKEEETE